MNAEILTTHGFKPILKHPGLPHSMRMYGLRTTCATVLLKIGQHPKYIQELLGHTTTSITLDTYSHVLPGVGDGLADALDG